MGRWHLFEFEDQAWFPDFFRNYLTDHLHYAVTHQRAFYPIAAKLSDVMRSIGEDRIVDIGSGGGGAIPQLLKILENEHNINVSAVLTDKYPHLESFQLLKDSSNGKIDFVPESVDATMFPKNLKGFRTLFTVLHHFHENAAKIIIKDAVENRAGIGVFEIQKRKLSAIVKLMIFLFMSCLCITPRLPRKSFARFFWTYIVPIGPAVMLWDGFASSMRTYSLSELRALTENLDEQNYHVEIGEMENTILNYPGLKFLEGERYTITYLIAYPEKIVSSHPV